MSLCASLYRVEQESGGGLRVTALEKRVAVVEQKHQLIEQKHEHFVERTKLKDRITAIEQELRDLEDSNPVVSGCILGVIGTLVSGALVLKAVSWVTPATPGEGFIKLVVILVMFGPLVFFPTFAIHKLTATKEKLASDLSAARSRMSELEQESAESERPGARSTKAKP